MPSEENDPHYRRIPQFYEVWNTSAFRLMENSFDNAHFAFVHKGTFGQLSQPLPEKYQIDETDYGFEAETLITVANPPVQHRIAGTTDPTTKRHMRNKWYMPFCRKLDIEYPSGLRHIIFNSATPIDDDHIQVVQWLYRNDTEADCSTKELIDWDYQITREDKDIIESTDPDTPIDMSRRIEAHMVSDRPGMIMRRRLMKLIEDHGEVEMLRSAQRRRPSRRRGCGIERVRNAMPQAAALAGAERSDRYPFDDFRADIAGIEASTELIDLKRRSRDYFWYSPILYEMLKDKVADIVVTPRDEAEVVRVAAACAKHRIPLTVRGGATGNYGQCVPLEGGVVLDMAVLDRIEWQKPGLVRVQAGAKLYDIDAATRPNGFELRMHPSTKRSATDRRLCRRRQRRGRQCHFRRHARAGQYRRRADRDARARSPRHRAARRRRAEDQPRLRHDRHHHRS